MPNPLIRRMENFTRLSALDKTLLDRMVNERVRKVDIREDLIHEGDRPDHINVVLSGWGFRYKTLEDGRRQIIAFFLPGDICDLNVFILREMDHSVGALTPLTIAEVHRDTFQVLEQQYPRVFQALQWETLVAAAVQREWTVNLGARSAFERLGHLFCELFLRLRAVGLTNGNSFELPVTQVDLGDAAGLTNVHVNRTLQELRAAKLIILQRGVLTIPDLDALMAAAFFSPNYLHLDHIGGQFDANEA